MPILGLEVLGLLSGTAMDPDPPLEIVSLDDVLLASIPRYHTTLVVRLKGSGKAKARLCLRGDTVEMRFSNFASAPTVEKSIVRIVISTAATYQWDLVMVGVTRAFYKAKPLLIQTDI